MHVKHLLDTVYFDIWKELCQCYNYFRFYGFLIWTFGRKLYNFGMMETRGRANKSGFTFCPKNSATILKTTTNILEKRSTQERIWVTEENQTHNPPIAGQIILCRLSCRDCLGELYLVRVHGTGVVWNPLSYCDLRVHEEPSLILGSCRWCIPQISREYSSELLLTVFDALLSQVEFDQELLRSLSYTCRGSFAPLVAAMGGIAAQEALTALTGKFSPVKQWVGTVYFRPPSFSAQPVSHHRKLFVWKYQLLLYNYVFCNTYISD